MRHLNRIKEYHLSAVILLTHNVRLHLLFLIFIPCGLNLKAQDRTGCIHNQQTIDSLVSLRLYKDAANDYFQTFRRSASCKTSFNLLKAAKICALAGETDSMYTYLTVIVNRKAHSLYVDILAEPDFFIHKRDSRWLFIKSRLDVYLASIATELIDLYTNRLKMDSKLRAIEKYHGQRSRRYLVFADSVAQLDTINDFKLKSMIRTWGWLGVDQVDAAGVQAEIYLFEKLKFEDQKKYYSFIATAFKNKVIDGHTFAALSDRIALKDQGFQIYGTQIGKNNLRLPVENPDSLNFRRVQIGLNPIADL
ncbi:DUF6624 domain-containing protein [Mucilaginibacter aquaedulcis]|uniref:DUF6624 domain-containing protein n=1 Tax=Mucilaginibacter aquaedulcis TaxID=1187081 RepID=UPI0025B58E1A|nr:DUF6624 domain-containing protein [Mucilaginibacter aquaedulcis]MDN3548891.1 hypothetical protein [Mucilaginibacter aquaedulcis]